MSTSTLEAMKTRQARTAEALAAECVRRWKENHNAVEVARRLKVTAAFFWMAVDRAGARTFHDSPKMGRDIQGDPIDSTEVEGWRTLRELGMTDSDIADEAGVSVRIVRAKIGLADAPVRPSRVVLDLPPKLRPLSPVGPLTPTSECPHKGRIPKGSPFVCLVCHQSGYDSHPKVMFDPAVDVPADPVDDYEESTAEWVALAATA